VLINRLRSVASREDDGLRSHTQADQGSLCVIEQASSCRVLYSARSETSATAEMSERNRSTARDVPAPCNSYAKDIATHCQQLEAVVLSHAKRMKPLHFLLVPIETISAGP
jgi:hypothetical protein